MKRIPPQNPKVIARYDSAGALVAIGLIIGIVLTILDAIRTLGGLEW